MNKTNHPKKSAEKKKSESLKIVMTPVERAILEVNAADAGMSMSELLLSLLAERELKRQKRLAKAEREQKNSFRLPLLFLLTRQEVGRKNISNIPTGLCRNDP